jgi:hypothetical protein
MGDSQPADLTVPKEAEILARYLLKRTPDKASTKRYSQIVNKRQLDSELSPKDTKLLGFCLNHPWGIGFIDSYLALFNPSSQVRYRLYIMVAVLESTTEYTRYFLPTKHSPLYAIYIIFVGFRAVIKVPFGLALALVAGL